MASSSTSSTYAQAGVDIDAGNQLVERIKPLAKSTSRAGSISGLGGFGALFDLKATGFKDPLLVSSTDGVGTKLKLAIETNNHATIGIDLVAMCVNDLVVQGAEPLFFLDYFACGKLSVDQGTAIIGGIAEGCRRANCALIGGETAEMPGMYAEGDYDLAGFTVGAVERDLLLPRDVAQGDVLLGLASSGVHSNGYSLVRHIVKNAGLDFTSPSPFGNGSLGEALLTPTRIYVKSCLAAIRMDGRDQPGPVKALAHITGGGLLENIPRVLPDTLSAEIDAASWQLPPVFEWLQQAGSVETHEMHRTFNCGIGMVLAVAPDRADAVAAKLGQEGETVCKLGRLVKREDLAVIMR